jgi:hypothetical protein
MFSEAASPSTTDSHLPATQLNVAAKSIPTATSASARTMKAVATVLTPPPRTRTKTKRLASAEAQEADAAATRARKKSKVIVQKNVKHTHSQRMQKLQNNEVCMLPHLTEPFVGLIFS